MALHKQVKIGGSYYKGYELLVSASTGTYIKDMSLDADSVINSINITCDVYGSGDIMKLNHMNVGFTESLALLAESLFNPGAGISIGLDFPALEPMGKNESLRLTYENTAGVAVAVHIIVEYCGITKKA